MYFWEYNFVFLRDCGTFSKRVKFQKKNSFFGHFSIIYHGQGHGKFLPSKYSPLVNYLPMVNIHQW